MKVADWIANLKEYQSIIGVLKAMMLQDQLDVANLVIEYSYSDKLKERGVSSIGGRHIGGTKCVWSSV
eukprot:219263-Amphidinium_carterae.2